MASSEDLLHGETEDCCCCCESYESFANGITTTSTPPKKDVCVRRLKKDKKCACALCEEGVIFNGPEFDDLGDDLERVLCLCKECAGQPIWHLKIWDSPNIQPKQETVVAAGVYASQEAIEKNLEQIGKGIEKVEEVLKNRKFCANQEQDAYENDWDDCME
jgi:hypothetical protein